MDIFTTVLTNVRPNPIKSEKRKVKGLKKEAETRELSEDLDHLEDHDLYFIDDHSDENTDEKKQRQQKEHPQSENETANNTFEHRGNLSQQPERDQPVKTSHEFSDEYIVPSESVITDKQEILHPTKEVLKRKDDDIKGIKHLDIFV